MKTIYKVGIAAALVVASIVFWPKIRAILGMDSKAAPTPAPGAGSNSQFTATTGHPPSVAGRIAGPVTWLTTRTQGLLK